MLPFLMWLLENFKYIWDILFVYNVMLQNTSHNNAWFTKTHTHTPGWSTGLKSHSHTHTHTKHWIEISHTHTPTTLKSHTYTHTRMKHYNETTHTHTHTHTHTMKYWTEIIHTYQDKALDWNLVGYSPRGRKESDMTQWLNNNNIHLIP